MCVVKVKLSVYITKDNIIIDIDLKSEIIYTENNIFIEKIFYLILLY